MYFYKRFQLCRSNSFIIYRDDNCATLSVQSRYFNLTEDHLIQGNWNVYAIYTLMVLMLRIERNFLPICTIIFKLSSTRISYCFFFLFTCCSLELVSFARKIKKREKYNLRAFERFYENRVRSRYLRIAEQNIHMRSRS